MIDTSTPTPKNVQRTMNPNQTYKRAIHDKLEIHTLEIISYE
jgi:hypothetical protein